MSTTFGVKIPSTGEIEPIATRVGIGNGKVEVCFTNPLAEFYSVISVEVWQIKGLKEVNNNGKQIRDAIVDIM